MTSLKAAAVILTLHALQTLAGTIKPTHVPQRSSSYSHPHGYSTASSASASAVPVTAGYPGGGPTATIDAGVVIGTTTSLPAATASVNKYLGVPFAKSPPTRFAPPESPGSFSAPINATAWSPACIQQFTYPYLSQQFTRFVFNNPAPVESEDCL